MAELAEIAGLAQRIVDEPELAQLLADKSPDVFETVIRASQFPLITWTPFGKKDPPSGQLAPLLAPDRIRICVCGNRSGKTEMGMFENVGDCLGVDLITKRTATRFKPPIEIWVVSHTEEASIEIAQRKIGEEVLGRDQTGFGWQLVKDNVKYSAKNGFTNNYIEFINGSRIDFKYSSQGVNAFMGTKKHKIHMDEEQPQEIYKECYARTIDYEGEMLVTFTPLFDRLHGISWIFNELYVPREENGIAFFNWSIFDNPHLTDSSKQALIDTWEEDEMDARAYGAFTPMGVRMAFAKSILRQQRANAKPIQAGYLARHNGTLSFYQRATEYEEVA